jgi:hypothetical protein
LAYVARFPLVIINHRQAWQEEPRLQRAESKQLAALASIKAASNGSTRCFFYLNSEIDFPELHLHSAFDAAGGEWWLKTDWGEYVWHKPGQHLFDPTNTGAREAWLAAALDAASHPFIDGLFIDKAKDEMGSRPFDGVSPLRNRAWRASHAKMIDDLIVRSGKTVILNNNHRDPGSTNGAGQLFERWGQAVDHDDLTLSEDVTLFKRLSSEGLTTLARCGGEDDDDVGGMAACHSVRCARALVGWA